MTQVLNQLDPASFTEAERTLINRLNDLLQDKSGALPILIGREQVNIELPDKVFHLLVGIIRNMKQGHPIILFPMNESLTTKAASEFLGMSRPFLVDLLDQGIIPHHKVGTHRRVYLKDLADYQKKRDAIRKEAVDNLFTEVEKAGVYDNA